MIVRRSGASNRFNLCCWAWELKPGASRGEAFTISEGVKNGKETPRLSSNCSCRPARMNPAPPWVPPSARRCQHHGLLQRVQRPARRGQIGQIIPVDISIFTDGSFTFVTKTPPAGDLIKRLPGVPGGSCQDQGGQSAAKAQVTEYKIAEVKLKRTWEGVKPGKRHAHGRNTARSMGVNVVD